MRVLSGLILCRPHARCHGLEFVRPSVLLCLENSFLSVIHALWPLQSLHSLPHSSLSPEGRNMMTAHLELSVPKSLTLGTLCVSLFSSHVLQEEAALMVSEVLI